MAASVLMDDIACDSSAKLLRDGERKSELREQADTLNVSKLDWTRCLIARSFPVALAGAAGLALGFAVAR